MTVLDDVQDYIQRYVALPEGAGIILSSFVIHTWNFEASDSTPYLFINSPEPRCGKSTLLSVLDKLVRNPIMAVEITAPTLTRLIASSDHPTVMLDEIDCVYQGRGAGNQQLRGILNAGYKKGGKVYRTQGQNVMTLDVFSPKIIAGIDNGKLPSTLLDRSIAITLQRKDAGALEPFYSTRANTDDLMDAVEEWSETHGANLAEFPFETIPELGDRVSELAYPLLAIANEFGRKDEMLSAIMAMFGVFKAHRGATMADLAILRDLADIFDMEGSKVFTETIMEYTDRNARQLALDLEPFGIASVSVRRGNRVGKGYKLDDVMPVLAHHGVR